MIKGSYSGTLKIGEDGYMITLNSNTITTRVEVIKFNSDPFVVLGQSNNFELLLSAVVDKEKLEVYGDYKLYNTVMNTINTATYYYYKDEEIIQDNIDFNENGIVHIYQAENSNKDLSLETEVVNDITKKYKFKCANNTIELDYKGEPKDLKKRGKLTYTTVFNSNDFSETNSSIITYRSLNEIALVKDLTKLMERAKNYKIINTLEEFKKFKHNLLSAMSRKCAVSVDTETTGTNFNRFPVGTPGRDELVGICISWQVGAGYYIPVGHLAIDNLDINYVLKELKYILEHAHVVTHYGKFDYMVFWSYGIKLNIQDDTYLIQYMLNNIDIHENLKLKSMTQRILGIDQIELSDIFPNAKDGDTVKFQILPYEIVRVYACADADFTLSLYAELRDKIDKRSITLYKNEVFFMRVLAETEYYGNKVNMDLVYEEQKRCQADIEVLEKAIYQEAGYAFNINSSQILSDLLYNQMHCEVITKTSTGAPSTGVTALKNLSKKYLDNPRPEKEPIISTYKNSDGTDNVLIESKVLMTAKYPIIHMILAYKKLVKLNTTFFEGFKRDNDNGWLFSDYNQTRAKTGRNISNFQQISKKLKHLITEWDGYYMINLDYSSIELRVMVGVAQETEVVKGFSHPEADPHRIIGSQILKKPPEDIDHDERQRMKIADFGVPFDMGPSSLATFLEGYPITKEKISRARVLKSDYLNSMPRVKAMFQTTRDDAQRDGIVITQFGRIGRFANLPKETDEGLIARGRRQAGNLKIQGTAADIMKIATNNLFRKRDELGLDFYITGHIHDELILVVNKNIHPYKMIELIKDCMELDLTHLGFPNIYTGIAVSSNWGEGKNEDIREIPVLLAERMRQMSKRGEFPDMGGLHPKEFILNEIREYLLQRFKQYFVNLGLNLEHPDQSKFNYYIDNFKDMFLTPRAVAYYTKNGKEPKNLEAVTRALADTVGMTYEEVKAIYEANQDQSKNAIEVEEVRIELEDDPFADMIEEIYDEEEDGDIIQLADYILAKEENIKSNVEKLVILNTFDEIILDVSNTTPANFNSIVQYLQSMHTPTGVLKISFNHNGKNIPSELRVNNIDRDYLTDLLLNLNVKTG